MKRIGIFATAIILVGAGCTAQPSPTAQEKPASPAVQEKSNDCSVARARLEARLNTHVKLLEMWPKGGLCYYTLESYSSFQLNYYTESNIGDPTIFETQYEVGGREEAKKKFDKAVDTYR